MNEREDFELWLKSKWDGDAMKAAQASFEKTEKKAKETDSALKDMGLTAEALKGQLVGLLAAGAVWDQFKEGFEQVAALEQAMNQLERAAKRNGDNFDVVKGKIVGMANALKKAAGVDDDAAIKRMAELYDATGDVGNAMNLVALATDVATARTLDFQTANDLVRNAAMGNVRSLRELDLSIDTTGNKAVDADRALAELTKQFGGAAENAKGLKVEINRLSESYEDMRNNLVEKLTPALGISLNAIKSFFTALDGAWRVVSDAFIGTLGFLGKFGSYMKALLTGDVKGMKDAVVAMGNEARGTQQAILQGAEETAKKLKAIWSGAGPGQKIDAGPAKNIVRGGGGEGDEVKEKVNEWQKELDRWHQMQGEIQSEMLKRALEAEKKFEAAKLALKKAGAKETERIEKELDKERDRLMDVQTARIRDEVRVRRAAEEAKREQSERTLDAALGAAYAMFGETKELAIAETVISTYRGATAASPNYILMALLIAAGLANVAKIVSTEPGGSGDATRGSGFDSPGNDAAARAGGRRWAMDMIGEWSGGVRQGWSEGMSGFGGRSISNDNSRTYNIHFHGAGFLDPSLLSDAKKLKRTIDVVDRNIDSQRTIARARRS